MQGRRHLWRTIAVFGALAGLLALTAPAANAGTPTAQRSGVSTAASCGAYEYHPGVGFRYDPGGHNRHVTTEYWNQNYRLKATATSAERRYNLLFCYDIEGWVLVDRGNSNFVSAELGYTGNNYALLRSRASAIGPWEVFDLLRWSLYDQAWIYQYSLPTTSGTFVFKSRANGRFVAAEFGWDGRLRARATAIGPWEMFYFS
jgi:hypothetical protein